MINLPKQLRRLELGGGAAVGSTDRLDEPLWPSRRDTIELLAYAARYGFPFPELLIAFRTRPHRNAEAEERLISGLRDGRSLGDLLGEISLYPALPEATLRAVREAERQGRLAELLPVLAAFQRRRRRKRVELTNYLSRSIWGWGATIFVASGFVYVLLRGLGKMLREVWISPSVMSFWFGLCTGSLKVQMVLFGVCLFLIGGMFSRRSSLMLALPVAGNAARRLALGELCTTFRLFLIAGDDILTAARYAREVEPTRYYRRRLDRMIERMECGENWLDAWNELGCRDPFARWILANGAAREKVAEAFADLRNYLDGRDEVGLEFAACIWNIVIILCGAELALVLALTVFQFLLMLVRIWL